MTINLSITPLENYSKIYVYQKCLVPASMLPNSIRCGTWTKCRLHDEEYLHPIGSVVCQVYTQTIVKQVSGCAFMEAAVTSGMDKLAFPTARLTQIEPLVEIKIDAVELIVFIRADYLKNPRKNWNLQALKESCSILLQAFCLTANCNVSSKELCRLGIKVVSVKALNCDENSCFHITKNTAINVIDVRLEMEENITSTLSKFHSIGFEAALVELKSLVERSKSKTLRGCLNALLVGSTGCGKSALMLHFAKHENCNYFRISNQDVLGQYPGETESKLRILFEGVLKFVEHFKTKAPTLIHIENLEQLCPAVRTTGKKDAGLTLGLCSQLCSLLDKLNNSNAGIICLATTTDSKSLHKSLHIPGRFQHEIEIEPLNDNNRKQLFILMFLERFPLEKIEEKTLDLLVACTVGYVAADLALLLRAIEQARLHGNKLDMNEVIKEMLRKSKPTSLRTTDVTVLKSEYGFESIGGMASLKKTLQLNILTGLERAAAYKSFGLSLPKGILLYGPPGCAKTTIAKCLAAEAKMTFIATSGAEVYSPYVGCAEKFISKLFDTARKHAPCLIFLDEIDTLVGNRSLGNFQSSNDVQTRILSTLLTEMDGIVQTRLAANAYILVVAATNRPNMIDDALLRPGRFDQLIHVPAPDYESRLSILELFKQRMPFVNDDDSMLKDLAGRTQNFSGADICNLCNEAAMHAFRRDFNAEEILRADFEHVLKTLKPSLTQRQIDMYLDFKKTKLS